MPALKGLGCNNMTVPLAQYNIDWMHTSWGSWCWNYPKNEDGTSAIPQGVNWFFYLFDKVPAKSDIIVSLANPNHGLWWSVGDNEVDVKRRPQSKHFTDADAQGQAQLISQQIAAVREVQSNAKFALAASTQEHSPDNPYNYPCWHDALWAYLPQADRDCIKALMIHYYPQVQFWTPGDPRTFNKNPIKQELNRYKTWAAAQGRADLQLDLSEIGLKWDGVYVKPDNPLVYSYPWVVQQACDEVGADWSWFGFDHAAEGYVSLWNNGITQFGLAFASI